MRHPEMAGGTLIAVLCLLRSIASFIQHLAPTMCIAWDGAPPYSCLQRLPTPDSVILFLALIGTLLFVTALFIVCMIGRPTAA